MSEYIAHSSPTPTGTSKARSRITRGPHWRCATPDDRSTPRWVNYHRYQQADPGNPEFLARRDRTSLRALKQYCPRWHLGLGFYSHDRRPTPHSHPRSIRLSLVNLFDGIGDPSDYLGVCSSWARTYGYFNAIKCRLFDTTLAGEARRWWYRLLANSITR